MSSSVLIQNPTIETMERLRANSNLNVAEWFDLIEMNWNEYQQFKTDKNQISDRTIDRLSDYFSLTPVQVRTNQIDFKTLTLKMEKGPKELPEAYSKAAYGRKRTSITSLDFVEEFAGWRVRTDVLKSLGVSETALLDPFASISMKFITDLCSYLERRQFKAQDFFAMGAYSFASSRNSVVGKLYSEMPNAAAAYDFFFNSLLKLFEQNCTYTITRMGRNDMTVDYLTNQDVAAESGVRHLGNQHVCHLKTGFISVIPRYLGLPASKITKTACVHTGDPVCRLEIDFSEANRAQATQSFSS
jgi:hypothetical protein